MNPPPKETQMKTSRLIQSMAAALLAVSVTSPVAGAEQKGLGYQDTPMIPGTRWHVHKLTACFGLRTFRAPDLHYALQLRVTPRLAVHEGSTRA